MLKSTLAGEVSIFFLHRLRFGSCLVSSSQLVCACGQRLEIKQGLFELCFGQLAQWICGYVRSAEGRGEVGFYQYFIKSVHDTIGKKGERWLCQPFWHVCGVDFVPRRRIALYLILFLHGPMNFMSKDIEEGPDLACRLMRQPEAQYVKKSMTKMTGHQLLTGTLALFC